jgi:hypothetical protein
MESTMLELVTMIAAGSVAATFFSDIASRVVKGVTRTSRRETPAEVAQ